MVCYGKGESTRYVKTENSLAVTYIVCFCYWRAMKVGRKSGKMCGRDCKWIWRINWVESAAVWNGSKRIIAESLNSNLNSSSDIYFGTRIKSLFCIGKWVTQKHKFKNIVKPPLSANIFLKPNALAFFKFFDTSADKYRMRAVAHWFLVIFVSNTLQL